MQRCSRSWTVALFSEFLHLSFTRILFPVHTLTSLPCFPWIERQKHSAAPRTKQTCCACALGDMIIDYLCQPRTHRCSSCSSIPNFNRPVKRRKKKSFREVDSFRLFAQKICPFELIICEQIAMTLINIGFSFAATGSE